MVIHKYIIYCTYNQMPNTFYFDACNVDSRMTPFPPETKNLHPDPNGLDFFVADKDEDGKLMLPHSIMNDNVAINYRTIYNGYPLFSQSADFTEYSDYERCVMKDKYLAAYLQDKKNPTYKNIIKYYSSEDFDPFGLARYKMQDFIYLKYYNQIPNNYMITLRRYTRPCEDHMFGLDMPAEYVASMNNYTPDYFALATAVTYMGEKTGNKLSDILKFDYGANWEERTGQTESLQNPDGGLAAQLRKRGIDQSIISGEAGSGGQTGRTAMMKSIFMMSAMAMGKGKSINDVMASQHQYEGNTFNARYGEQLYGDVNVDKATRTKIYDFITKPVHKDSNGNYMTALQKYQSENTIEAMKNFAICYTLTNGFKDWSKLGSKQAKREVKKGLANLEKVINSTSRNNDGSLGFVSFDESSYLGQGMQLDI